MESEVARIRQRIAEEAAAAQAAVTGIASGTARHRFITARMERVAQLRSDAACVIGDTAATMMVCDVLEAVL